MSATRTPFDEVQPGLPPALRISPAPKLSSNRVRFLRFLSARAAMTRSELQRDLGSGHCVTYRTFTHLHRHGLIALEYQRGTWRCSITDKGRALLHEYEGDTP